MNDWLDSMLQDANSLPLSPSSSALASPPQPTTLADVDRSSFNIKADDQYKLWMTPLLEVLQPLISARGKQLRPVNMGSHCTALCSEFKVLELFNIKSWFPYVCDHTERSFFWIQSNGPERPCHFCDMRELISTRGGYCFEHGQRCELSEADSFNADAHVNGTSCKPFSMVNQYRHVGAGSAAHSEADLMWYHIHYLLKEQPLTSLLENVFGFLIRESKTQENSPLQQFLDVAKRKVGHLYSIQVFYLDASCFLVYTRRRVWIHFMHKAAGGAQSHALMASVVKACVHNRLNKPPLRSQDLMLPNDHPAVLKFNADMAKKKLYITPGQDPLC